MENTTSQAPRLKVLLACATLTALGLASTFAPAAGAARVSTSGFKGVWVATGPSGKTVLRLLGAGARYHGTYTLVRRTAGKKTKKKVLRVKARTGAADGAAQLTLTFTKTNRSALCGLAGARLYCQLGSSEPTVFVRR